MSPTNPDDTTATQAASDADALAKQIDDVLEEVLTYLAGALSATGEQASQDLAQTKALINGEVKYLAGQLDPTLSDVVGHIYDTIRYLDTISQQQADQLVLLLQQFQQQHLPGQPGLKLIGGIPPGIPPHPVSGYPGPPTPVTGYPPQPTPPGTIPIPPQPRPITGIPPIGPGGQPQPPPPIMPKIPGQPPGGPQPPPHLPTEPFQPPPIGPILPYPPPGTTPPIQVPPPVTDPNAPPFIPPQPIGYTPGGEPIYLPTGVEAPPSGTQAPNSVAPGQPGDVTTITRQDGNVLVTVNLPAPEVIVEQSPGEFVSVTQTQSQTGPTVNVADTGGEKLPKTALPPGISPVAAEKPPEKAGPLAVPKDIAFACASGQAPFRVGSDGWCASLDLFLNGIKVTVGPVLNWFVARAKEGHDLIDEIPADIEDKIKDIPDPFYTVFELFVKGPANIMKAVADVMWRVWEGGLCIIRSTTCDDPVTIQVLVGLRALVNALKRFRIGTDAGLWATIDVTVEWDQAEQVLDYMIAYVCPYLIPTEGQAINAVVKGWIGEDIYRCWMHMGGHDVNVFSPIRNAATEWPGFAQRQQLLWRLRPDRPKPLGPDPTDGKVYTEADFTAHQEHDGQLPFWKPLLHAIRYQIYTLRELRQLMDANRLDENGAYQIFRDLGYDETKAAELARMERIETDRRKATETQGWTTQKAIYCYERGEVDILELGDIYRGLWWNEDQADVAADVALRMDRATQARSWAEKAKNALATATERAYKEGLLRQDDAVNTLMTVGAKEDAARSLTLSWSTELNLDQRKQALNAIKKGWNSGYVSDIGALNLLIQANYLPEFAATTVRNWRSMRNTEQTILSGQQVLTALQRGEMSGPVALARLTGMGWEVHDAEILIEEALQELAKQHAAMEAKLEAKAAKEYAAAEKAKEKADAKSAKYSAGKPAAAAGKAPAAPHTAEASTDRAAAAAEKLALQGTAAYQLAIKVLRADTPPALMKSLLKKGLISQEKYRKRMEVMGYDKSTIELDIADICAAQSAVCTPTDGPQDATLPDGEKPSGGPTDSPEHGGESVSGSDVSGVTVDRGNIVPRPKLS